jgi:uncharacterized membrane protein YuzA (DUF378 family)
MIKYLNNLTRSLLKKLNTLNLTSQEKEVVGLLCLNVKIVEGTGAILRNMVYIYVGNVSGIWQLKLGLKNFHEINLNRNNIKTIKLK